MRKRWHLLSGAALALTTAGLITAGLVHQLRRVQLRDIHLELDEVRTELQTELHDRLHLVRGMAAFVELKPHFSQAEYELYSSALIADQTGIRSLQLAPDGVIGYMTDPERNGAALGKDLLQDRDSGEVLRAAIPERKFHVVGPVPLIQGGQALIGRLSVHVTDPVTETEDFWGFASVLIEPEEFTRGLKRREEGRPLRFALCRAEDGARGDRVFYGTEDIFDEPAALVDIPLENMSWRLAVKAPLVLAGIGLGWYGLWASGIFLAGLLGWLLYSLLRRPAELRIAVVDATNALRDSEAKLQQSRKFEALGQLTGGMAHDFNNILAVIQGNLELLEMECGGQPAATESVAMATEATQKGAVLTRSLLSFARRQSLQPNHCSLNGLIESTASLLNSTLGPLTQVRTDLGEDLGTVWIDPAEFETTLLHLAVNAKHAMPEGGTLWIRTTRVDHISGQDHSKPVPHVLVTISDTGVGMSEDVLAHAFEPFFTTRPGIGSGLGLSMIYGFVNQSDGDIEIKSQVGGGTTVRIFLPVSGKELPPGASPEASSSPPIELAGHTVLVAEDNASVRRVVVAQLQALGLHVLEATQASAAEQLHSVAERVDLLLTDVIMPGEASGYDLAETLRRRQPDIGVVFMSGYEAGEQRPEGIGGQMLHKPFRHADLLKALRNALERPQGANLGHGEAGSPADSDQDWAATGVSVDG